MKQAFEKKKNNKRAISQHVMLKPDHFVISNISKHLAGKKKHLTLFLESKIESSLHLNNVNKKKKKKKKEHSK